MITVKPAADPWHVEYQAEGSSIEGAQQGACQSSYFAFPLCYELPFQLKNCELGSLFCDPISVV